MGADIVVTGSRGVIGSVVIDGLAGRRMRPADLPEHDLRDREVVERLLRGARQVVHLAWNSRTENFRSGTLDPDNTTMLHNVLDVALAVGVSRVLLASSVHADTYPAPADGAVLNVERSPYPDSPYGADKVFGEALGRYYSTRGLQVVAVRFGGVNRRDVVPVADLAERAVWLSHRDCVGLVRDALDAPLRPGTFSSFYGVSDNYGRWHDLANDIGWWPRESDTNRDQVKING